MSNSAPSREFTLRIEEYDLSLTSETIEKFFSDHGYRVNVLLPNHPQTGNPLGYGFINFVSRDDMEKALRDLNWQSIPGYGPLQLNRFASKDSKPAPDTQIFVKSLPNYYTSQQLCELFRPYGTVLISKVKNSDTGSTGIVTFETQEQAEDAKTKMNGSLVEGKKIVVEPYDAELSKQHLRQAVIKSLPLDITQAELMTVCGQYCPVTDAFILDTHESSSRTALVTVRSPADVEVLISHMHNKPFPRHTADGQALATEIVQVEKAKPRWQMQEQKRQQKAYNLTISGFPPQTEDSDLIRWFSPFGNITSCKIMRDEDGISKEYGFCSFDNMDSCQKAVAALNGKQPTILVHSRTRQTKEDGSAEEVMQEQEVPIEGTLAVSFATHRRADPPPRTATSTLAHAVEDPEVIRGQALTQMLPPGVRKYAEEWYRWYQSHPNAKQPQWNYSQNIRYPQYPPYSGYPQYPPYPQYPGQQYNRGPYTQPPPHYPPQPYAPQPPPQPYAGAYPPAMAQAAQPPPQPTQPPQLPPQAQGPMLQPTPISPQELPPSPEERKNYIGERLYHLIAQVNNELAGKITGMLLELPESDQLAYLSDPNRFLLPKIQEAVRVLKAQPH